MVTKLTIHSLYLNLNAASLCKIDWSFNNLYQCVIIHTFSGHIVILHVQQRTSIAMIIVELSVVESPFSNMRVNDFSLVLNANMQDFILI